ncbi:class I tRNA ligase family protein [Streptomyces sp. DW26H14]|uniref:class I tRNA ligase family protein n=1 Tax=Streptomyces sp. DW26H14 TaxID=3435395 RepID=UPI00403D72F9
MTVRRRPRIVVPATPTPNGDLHVGHMAGPYLAADIYARALRAQGEDVTLTTITDNNQSYVVTTAARLGTTPERLCERSTSEIETSLAALGVELTAPAGRCLPPVGDGYRDAVTGFVTALRDSGRLRARTVALPYAETSGVFLYDGLLSGVCPHCEGQSAGGVCEDCGHPNNFAELSQPRYSAQPDEPVVLRERRILVLPMEEHRPAIEARIEEAAARWRPRPLALMRQLLDGPLPEIPVTFPGRWGTPAPFEDFADQIVYPWVEAMPASMYATWWAHGGPEDLSYDEFWRSGREAELVYFHGFDNVYHWALMDLALLLAHGERYITPSASVCNEFYELRHEKFSTSRGHLVRATELVAHCPRDVARFHLALTCPERERTNFDPAELAAGRLTGPWNELAGLLDTVLAGCDWEEPMPVTEAGRAADAAFAGAVRGCFELETFSLAEAARLIVARATELCGDSAVASEPGDLLLAVRTLLAWAAPILVDTAAKAAADGVELTPAPGRIEKIMPFRLPRLVEAETADEGL